jgi:hypothetical protein
MNSSLFYTKVRVPKPSAGCTNRFEDTNGFSPSGISSLIWMKTQLVMITLIPKSTPTNFGMES